MPERSASDLHGDLIRLTVAPLFPFEGLDFDAFLDQCLIAMAETNASKGEHGREIKG
jgi:hypothetical protein